MLLKKGTFSKDALDSELLYMPGSTLYAIRRNPSPYYPNIPCVLRKLR